MHDIQITIQDLQTMGLLKNLERSDLEELASIVTSMRVHEGETITHKGSSAHTVYLVISGNFMVHFEDGRALTFHGHGQVIGWAAVVTPFFYTGTAVALTDGEVLAIKGQDLLELVQANSEFGNNIMKKTNEVVADRIAFIQGLKELH
ncbi:Cyclic nucleotide-binding domain-containing protein [Candidatus Magnetomoraceae bacterium gMMP-15]